MAKGNGQKQANDSALEFEARLWAAAGQSTPASRLNQRIRWPCASTKSGWFIKNEPQRAEAAENYSLSASNGERAGVRCRIHSPPANNANYCWIQHLIHHLSPGGAGTSGGVAGFVMADNPMSNQTSNEADIAKPNGCICQPHKGRLENSRKNSQQARRSQCEGCI